jgi:N-methylhydantoinase B/oxoprolinase/acetone carboxylase alpha subunit
MPKPENIEPHKFKPGQSGNPKGRPKLIDLKEVIKNEVGDEGIAKVIKALMKRAEAGDVRAIQELLDRGYGKAQSHVDHTSGGEKITININTDLI